MRLPDTFPDELRAAGLEVIEVDDWERRGRPASTGSFDPVGSLNHHTGASAKTWSRARRMIYAKWMFITGRSDLPPPLCQWALGPDGEVYVGAAGRANHAGTAKASGSVAAGDGNRLYAGGEWMLSGTESIPEKMLKAGATVNAVILKILGSSSQAVSCHYNTSTTGKWDIGDPNGISFKGTRVLDVPRFRKMVDAETARLKGKPVKPKPPRKPYVPQQADELRLTFQHTSLQYSDGPKAQRRDAEKIFSRGKDVLTGTEAGQENPNYKLVAEMADKYGYRLKNYRSNWVAVRKELITRGSWEAGEVFVADTDEVYGPGHDSAFPWISWETPGMGRISVAAGHYPTKGRTPNEPNWDINERYALKIGEWIDERSKGKWLAFYAGDQNMPVGPGKHDPFFGEALTTAQDEAKRWENTGHGPIDHIASADGDKRVRLDKRSLKVLDDKEFPLATDHYLVECDYLIKKLA